MKVLDLVRRRMAAQRLTGDGHDSVADVVRALGAMQAQEFAEAKWSIAERIEGEPTDAAIEGAFARGEIVRTHVLRPTWHFVAPEDLRWMQMLTAPRVHQANRYWYAQLGLDDDLLRRGSEVIAAALGAGEPLLRTELREALADAGIDVAGPALGHMTAYAELESVICSGPRRGKQQTYALVDDVIPPTPAMSREEALSELTRRYFGGHGPATAHDFSWWSGLTVTDARAGIASLGAELAAVEGPDGAVLHDSPRAPEPVAASGARLIPMYDELGVAFKSMRGVYAEQPPEGAMARPILVDGVTVGSWKRTLERRSVTIEATLFTTLGAAAERALGEVAERFGRFLELPVSVELTPARD